MRARQWTGPVRPILGDKRMLDRPIFEMGASAKPWNYETTVAVAIAALIALRMVVAAVWPLATDELLYWRYSFHLAPGYLDHPGMNPLLIRIGRSLFGETSLGVRFFAVALAVPASWAVWRAGELLLGGSRAGANAALLFNLTIVMSVGSMIATSDSVVVVTSALLLWAVAEFNVSQRGVWWLVIGAVIGVGMASKYTTLFLALSIVAWLAVTPELRKWFLRPWPYLGALIALAIFSPVLIWNAQHQWASLVYQSSRMVAHSWSIRYVIELIGAQIGLATPPIFVLAGFGLWWGRRLPAAERRNWPLLAMLVLPPLAYFLWHALHERVQGNWPECIYPAASCAAALAIQMLPAKTGPSASIVRWSERLAIPFALALAAIIYFHGATGLPALGRGDPAARMTGLGWREAAASIDEVRARAGTPVVVTSDYSMAVELSYYLPSHTPVEQLNERVRWISEPQPDPRLFTGPMLYVCHDRCSKLSFLPARFRGIEYLATVTRRNHGAVADVYTIYRLSRPIGPVLNPPYPVRVKGVRYDTL